MFLTFKNGVISIQTAGYNGARTVPTFLAALACLCCREVMQ